MAMILIMAIIFCSKAWGAIALENTIPANLPEPSAIQKLSYREMNEYLPEDLREDEDDLVVLNRFADKTLQAWWNTPEVQSAMVARTADRTERKMRADVTLRDQKKMDHRFVFRLQVIQGVASLLYSGWAHLEFRYESRSQQSAVELSEKLWRNKKIVFGHYLNPQEAQSAVGLRWLF